MNPHRSICVFCGSSDRVDPVYLRAARELGLAIAQQAGTLIFGGSAVGMMRAVAEAAHEGGGHVIGVIPDKFLGKGIAYQPANELIVTDSMYQRKQVMADRAEAFVAMPGGFGTLEELFEVIAHKQLGYHDKPVVILNTDRFWDPLVELMEHMYTQGFAKEKYRGGYHVCDTVDQAMGYIGDYQPGPAADKWS